AIVEAVLNQLQDSFGSNQIPPGDTQQILALEHQKIGIGDSHQRSERHDLAVETAGGSRKLGGAQQIAVAAPEVDHIAGVQCDAVDRELAATSAAAAAAAAA